MVHSTRLESVRLNKTREFESRLLRQAFLHLSSETLTGSFDRIKPVVQKNNFPIELSTVIVSWNVKDYLRNCIASLEKACKQIGSEIIVVDNNSKDGSITMLKNEFPQVKLIANRKNLGLSRANNQGAHIAKGKNILFLNPDTVVNSQAIEGMLGFLTEHPQAGLVGPEQLDEENKTIFNFSRWSLRGVCEYLFERVLMLIRGKFKIIFQKPYRTSFLNGGCWLTPRSVFEGIGQFNEEFFLYGEEPDFCSRLRKNGWQIWFLRNFYIFHFREKSISQTGKKKNFFLKSYSKIIKNVYLGRYSSEKYKKNKT